MSNIRKCKHLFKNVDKDRALKFLVKTVLKRQQGMYPASRGILSQMGVKRIR